MGDATVGTPPPPYHKKGGRRRGGEWAAVGGGGRWWASGAESASCLFLCVRVHLWWCVCVCVCERERERASRREGGREGGARRERRGGDRAERPPRRGADRAGVGEAAAQILGGCRGAAWCFSFFRVVCVCVRVSGVVVVVVGFRVVERVWRTKTSGGGAGGWGEQVEEPPRPPQSLVRPIDPFFLFLACLFSFARASLSLLPQLAR